MLARRSVIVTMAVLFGVVAGGAAYAYLHSVQDRAYGNARLTDVYVAEATIPQGETGDTAISDGLIEKTQIPARFKPAGALSDLASIRGQVSVAIVPAGEVVVAGLFASPALAAVTPAENIPKGDVAITISVDPVHGVAGLIEPGDHVDILTSDSGRETYLYQDVAVLAVGTSIAPRPGSVLTDAATPPTGSGTDDNLITFAVPADAAARIAGTTDVYLALVPPGSGPVVPVPSVSLTGLIPLTPTPQG